MEDLSKLNAEILKSKEEKDLSEHEEIATEETKEEEEKRTSLPCCSSLEEHLELHHHLGAKSHGGIPFVSYL